MATVDAAVPGIVPLPDQADMLDSSTYALIGTSAIFTVVLLLRHLQFTTQDKNLPPHIPSTIPFLGHAVNFGKAPLDFLKAAYETYGPVFSFTMVGQTFTYLIGSESSALFFDSKNENLNAEDVYNHLTSPIFGKGVAYDAPNHVFLEQKKLMKSGLNISNYRRHIPLIEKETREYVAKWGSEGKTDMFESLSELIILTASSCLHGKEIREAIDERVAGLYSDLDGGFSHAAWLLPGWIPLPSFRRRDAAHIKIKELFFKAIAKRRANIDAGEEIEPDMLQTLIDGRYKEGRPLSDDEISGMLIGLLLAGQHTSSTTGSWLAFFLAKYKDIQEECYEEQLRVFGNETSKCDYDGLKECTLLDRCLKESLRLRPPIMTMMRMCRNPQNVMGYTIPVGHQICVSPTTNQQLSEVWKDCSAFNPDRFLDESLNDKFSYVPFGAGRHRCIGEGFAYVQIKTLMSVLLRNYEFSLVDGYFPGINYATMLHTPLHPVIHYKKRVPIE